MTKADIRIRIKPEISNPNARLCVYFVRTPPAPSDVTKSDKKLRF